MQEIHLFARGLIKPKYRRYEPFYALLGAALGITLSFYWLSSYCFLIVITSFFFLFSAKRKGRRTLFVYGLSFIVGSLYLLTLSFPKQGTGEYLGLVIDTKDNYFVLYTIQGRYYVYSYDHAFEIGDILKIYGKAVENVGTAYEGKFYFPEYLAKRGISSRLYAYTYETVFSFPLRIRSIQENFLGHFSYLTSGLIDSLLFDRKDYSNDLIALSSSIGALYFLSSTGLIFQAFLSIGELLINRRLDKKKAKTITFFFSMLLLPFFFRKIGVWRVILVRGLALFIDKKGYSKPLRVDLVSYAGIIMVVLDPFMALQQGFLLGYGLSLLFPLASGTLNKYEGKKKKLASSLLVTFFLFPVFINGNAFHLFSPIYSLIFKPLTLPYAFLAFLSFIINIPFVSLLEGYSNLLYGLMNIFSYADIIIPLGNISGFIIYFYYLFFVVVLYFNEIGFPYPAHLTNRLFFLTILLRVYNPFAYLCTSITFINVGQGDSILIRDGFHSVLIDTGGNISFDMAEEVLIPYFRKIGLYHIDALITTHDDYDHSGAASSLMSSFYVDKWIDEASSFPLTIGNINLTNLNTYSHDSDEENDNSLVLYTELMDEKWLFMGDAPSYIEEKIIEDNPSLDCDILKVGHHGSNTSTSIAFLDAVTPSEAIISCGKNNSYGHPHEEIVERLEKRKITVRRTDIEGSIEYSSFRSFFS